MSTRKKIWIDAVWKSEDLDDHHTMRSMDMLSIHEHVINFRVNSWNHVLVLSDPTMYKGPKSIGLTMDGFNLIVETLKNLESAVYHLDKIEIFTPTKHIIVNLDTVKLSFKVPKIEFLDKNIILKHIRKNVDNLRKNIQYDDWVLIEETKQFDPAFEHTLKINFRRFLKGLLNQDKQTVETFGKQLIGLGFGSTPTGDDLMHGALIAYHFLVTNELKTNRINLNFEIENATTHLGHHMIEIGIKGYTMEPIITFLQAISEQEENIIDLSNIKKIGSSTGMNILTGIIITLKEFLI